MKKIEDKYIIDISSDKVGEFIGNLTKLLDDCKEKVDDHHNKFGDKMIKNIKYPDILSLLGFSFIIGFINQKLGLILGIPYFLFFNVKPSLENYYSDLTYLERNMKSVNLALNNLKFALEQSKYKQTTREDGKLITKEVYLGDDIKKYGLHATFLEIPGNLTKECKIKDCYNNYYGGNCYTYESQRRYLDKKYFGYVGDKIAERFKNQVDHALTYEK